jgi:ankyrin repeat protein
MFSFWSSINDSTCFSTSNSSLRNIFVLSRKSFLYLFSKKCSSLSSLSHSLFLLNASQTLRDAAFDGDMTEVKRLLLTGFDLESPDASGTTVLSEAAVGGKVEIVKLLLKLGADPNTSGVYGGTQKRTPLARAVFNNHVEVIKCLLDAGAYIQPVYTVVTPDTKAIQNLLNEWKDEEKSVEAQQKRRFELEKQLDQLSKKWSLADRTTLKLSRLRSRLLQHTMEGNVNEVVNELENFAYEQHEKNPNGKPSISAADIKMQTVGHSLL